jgi:FMN reductase
VIDIIAVIGNPNPGGRTTVVAELVTGQIAATVGGEPSTLELAGIAPHLFEWDNPDVDAAVRLVGDADVVVFACPTYKATYTGLLKSFLDRYGTDGLAGVVAIPVMIGAAPGHALAPEVHLRPLLVEMGATVPTRGLYVLDSAMDDAPETVARWMQDAGPVLTKLLR